MKVTKRYLKKFQKSNRSIILILSVLAISIVFFLTGTGKAFFQSFQLSPELSTTQPTLAIPTLLSNGERCTTHAQCSSKFCNINSPYDPLDDRCADSRFLPGTSCISSRQCQTGYACNRFTLKCTALALEDQACSPANSQFNPFPELELGGDCVSNLLCTAYQHQDYLTYYTDYSCRPPRSGDYACKNDQECIWGICIYKRTSGDYMCVPGNAPLGRTCENDRECASQLCASQLFTDSQGRQTLRDVCKTPGVLSDGSLCYKDKECTSGYCGTQAGVNGAHCMPKRENGRYCIKDVQCTSNFCAKRIDGSCATRRSVAVGQSCIVDEQCQSGVCYNNLCVASGLAKGVSCNRDQQCSSGLCKDASLRTCF